MRTEIAAVAVKSATSAAAAVGFASMSPVAWGAAFVGAAASYYFERSQDPRGAWGVIVGILAMGFAGALCALGIAYLPWMGIGDVAAQVPLDVRCGAFGLTSGLLYRVGRRALLARAGQ